MSAAPAAAAARRVPKLVLQPGVKTPSCVAFSVLSHCVPPPLLPQALAIADSEPSGRAAAVLALLAECEAVPEWGEQRHVRVRHRRVRLIHVLPDGRVLCAVHPTGVTSGSAKRGGKRGKHVKPAPPPPAPIVALFPDQDALLSAPAVHALRGASSLRATYKWNGENWLVKCRVSKGQGGSAAAPAPIRFELYRRCDRKPRPLAQELRNNLMNLLPPKCYARAAADTLAPLVMADGTCHTCGRLGGDALAAHIAHDAVVAARTGLYARFAQAYTACATDESGGSLEEADARALPFVTAPFKQSVFWFRRVAKADGRKRRGKAKKAGGKGDPAPRAAPLAPRERVFAAAAAEVWGYFERCVVNDAGKVCLGLGSRDFLPPDGVNWEPCHDQPDPVSQHWPGYALVGTLERKAAVGDGCDMDPLAAAVGLAADATAAKAARRSGSAGQGRSLVEDSVDTSQWALRLVVSRPRLPPRTGKEAALWTRMTRLRSTVWRAGVGDVPTEWRALRGTSTSGMRDSGPGARQKQVDGATAGEVEALCPSGFLIAAHEVARFKLVSDVPAQAVPAMRAVGAASRWYLQQLTALGHAVSWDDVDDAVVWEHSFEMVGADFQNNQEGLPKGVNLLVPHGWHPAGSEWLHPALHSMGVRPGTDAVPSSKPLVHALRAFSYFDFQRLFESDAAGVCIKEGIVLHAGSEREGSESKAVDDSGPPCEVDATVVKVRRDDFLGDDSPDLRRLAARYPVLAVAAAAGGADGWVHVDAA